MSALNYAQMITIGLLTVVWALVMLFGRGMPAGTALALGWGIAWVGLLFIPKLF